MQYSENLVKFLKEKEGLRLRAYKPVPSEKFFTIGHGHYGADVAKNQVITEKKADELLRDDIDKCLCQLSSWFDGLMEDKGQEVHELRQNEVDALLSFIFNLGYWRFRNSTLSKKLANYLCGGEALPVAKAFLPWRYAGGKILRGLTIRRAEEANMFLGADKFTVNGNDYEDMLS